jgi:hypothetical protein
MVLYLKRVLAEEDGIGVGKRGFVRDAWHGGRD